MVQLFKNTTDAVVKAVCGEEAFVSYRDAIDQVHGNGFGGRRNQYAAEVFQKCDDDEARLLQAFGEDGYDLGLLGLLAEDGVQFQPEKRAKWDHSDEDLPKQIQSTGLCGFKIPRDVPQPWVRGGIGVLFHEMLGPVLCKNATEKLRSIEQRRQTNDRILLIAERVTYYTLVQMMGKTTLAVPAKSPLLADLMGMNAKGQIMLKDWAGDQSAFQSSAESLFLNTLAGKSKPVMREERTHFDYVRRMAQSLTFLPAQAFVLQGEDPLKVMAGIRKKLEFLYTYRHGHNDFTDSLIDAGCKAPFLPFPHLWQELGIESADFLGFPIEESTDHHLMFPDCFSDSWHGSARLFRDRKGLTFQRLVNVLATQGVDFTDSKYQDRIGFGANYAVDLDDWEPGSLDDMVKAAEVYPDRAPSVLMTTWAMNMRGDEAPLHFMEGLSKCSREVAAMLVDKLLNKGAFQAIQTLTGISSYLTKEAMVKAIADEDQGLFQDVFALTLARKKPKTSIIKMLLKEGTPRHEDLEKLPDSQLDQVLERDLGL